MINLFKVSVLIDDYIYIYGKWWRFPCSKLWSTSGNGSECQHKVLGLYTIISELMESQLGTYGNEWEFMIIQGNHQWETLRSWAYSDIFMAPYTQCSYGIHLDPQSQYMGIDMRNPSTLEMMDKFRHGNGNCWRVVGKWWKMKLSSGMVHYCGSSIIICLIYINSKWLFGRGAVSNTHEGGHGKVLRDHGEHESRTHDIISGWSFNQ